MSSTGVTDSDSPEIHNRLPLGHPNISSRTIHLWMSLKHSEVLDSRSNIEMSLSKNYPPAVSFDQWPWSKMIQNVGPDLRHKQMNCQSRLLTGAWLGQALKSQNGSGVTFNQWSLHLVRKIQGKKVMTFQIDEVNCTISSIPKLCDFDLVNDVTCKEWSSSSYRPQPTSLIRF